MIVAVADEGEASRPHLGQVTLVSVVFCRLNLSVGYLAPRLLRVDRPQSVATAMEIGVHNETLAITIALSVLDLELLAVAPAVYSLLEFLIIQVFGKVITRDRRPNRAPSTAQGGPAA